MELRIKRAPRIDLEITVPGDKSISHRAVIVASLSNGVCTLRGFLPSEDCMHTVNAMRALGIKIEQPEPTILVVHGKKRVLTAPNQEINCGNSGTTMRLLAGLLAGQKFESRLVADPGLSKRPMDRVIAPLCESGREHVAQGPDGTAPLRIHGGSLHGIQYRPSAASAQVKAALLLAGLLRKARPPLKNHCRREITWRRCLTISLCDRRRKMTGALTFSVNRLRVTGFRHSRRHLFRQRFGWLPLRRKTVDIC